jgi:hypothetical protein
MEKKIASLLTNNTKLTKSGIDPSKGKEVNAS